MDKGRALNVLFAKKYSHSAIVNKRGICVLGDQLSKPSYQDPRGKQE